MLWLAISLLTINTALATENQKLENTAKILELLNDFRGNVASLRNDLKTVKNKLEHLSKQHATDTYTRWGRSSCPPGATTVYDGFTAGSHYTHSGAAANHMCLSKKPKYHSHYKKPKWTTLIYGAEYQTHGSIWDKLSRHEIPCAVCHVPRTSIIMIPGSDDCPDNFKIEYRGYLMAGYHTHKGGTEYICFDGNPTAAEYSSPLNNSGALFYFVEAVCGSLKCRPYESGKQITCAVCSYSP
ncbi:short-chain collagen C4-like [Ruditapes philippinarum]|uniref:short-chain collagen C4-like n=1 Tax=Ruditapes philippinarum TaxID=129788 RepID=UPI00295B052C|nr:short-chain collagen C4-like [Ruditapes philippinarum]